MIHTSTVSRADAGVPAALVHMLANFERERDSLNALMPGVGTRLMGEYIEQCKHSIARCSRRLAGGGCDAIETLPVVSVGPSGIGGYAQTEPEYARQLRASVEKLEKPNA